MSEFQRKVIEAQGEPLRAEGIAILQLNLGYRCNMSCKHCHIAAGPDRHERMERATIDTALQAAARHGIGTIDITGGAPELNPWFRYLVGEALSQGIHVIVRNNLTIFFEEGMEDLFDFYARYPVEMITSLPHYTNESVDRVRGHGAFEKSIVAMKRLNSLGYGSEGSSRHLHLVYNPAGAILPSSQKELEESYRKELFSRFGVLFNRLYVFANMPIGRFREFLVRTGNLDKYMAKVKAAFNGATLPGLMCRSIVSVGWDRTLYDCDFNQVLGMPIDRSCPQHLNGFDFNATARRHIVTGAHCFVCAAGQGST